MGLNRDKLKHNQSGDRFVFKEGDNYVRILPRSMLYFTADDDDFVYKYKVHYIAIPGEEQKKMIVCSTNDIKACPICMLSKALFNSHSDDDKALARQIYGRFRYLANMVLLDADDMGEVDMDKKYAVTHVSFSQKSVYDGIVSYLVNPKWGELLDPSDGRNFCIRMIPGSQTESGYNQYVVQPEPQQSKIKLTKDWKKVIDALKEEIPPISNYAEIYDALISAGFYANIDDMPKAMQNLFRKEMDFDIEIHESNDEPDGEPDVNSDEDDIPEYKVPEEAEEEDEEDDTKPACFGEEYSPRKSKCKKCEFKSECIEAFLESEDD